jgi:hypothetical protein
MTLTELARWWYLDLAADLALPTHVAGSGFAGFVFTGSVWCGGVFGGGEMGGRSVVGEVVAVVGGEAVGGVWGGVVDVIVDEAMVGKIGREIVVVEIEGRRRDGGEWWEGWWGR